MTCLKRMQQIANHPHHIDHSHQVKVLLEPLVDVPQFYRRIDLAAHVVALAVRKLRQDCQSGQQAQVPSRRVAVWTECTSTVHGRGRGEGGHVDAPVLFEEGEGGGGGVCSAQLVVGDAVERIEEVTYAPGFHGDLRTVEGLAANHVALLGAGELGECRHDVYKKALK